MQLREEILWRYFLNYMFHYFIALYCKITFSSLGDPFRCQSNLRISFLIFFVSHY